MNSMASPKEPAKRGEQPADRGVPPSYAAHAVRKDVTVRVSLTPPSPQEGEELKEHGYGHGV